MSFGVAGLLFFTGYLLAGPFAGSLLDPDTFVDTFAPGTFQAGMVFNMLAMILSFFGFFALYAYLVGAGERTPGTVGVVLAVVGNGLLLAVMAVPMGLIPAAADLYAGAPADAVALVEEVFTGPVIMMIFMATSLVLTAALAVFAWGLWRDGGLPTPAVGSLMLGYFLLTNAHFAQVSAVVFTLDLIGGAALATGSFWLALALGTRRTAPP